MLFPLLALVIRRDVPKQYASLKALCEARQSAGRAAPSRDEARASGGAR